MDNRKACTVQDADLFKSCNILCVNQDCDDHDGRVSFKDFCTAVQGDKLLMESLGQCLPAEEA